MTRGQKISLRALQVYCAVSVAIAILGGGAFVLLGTDGLGRVVGVEYPALVAGVQGAMDEIPSDVRVTVDTWFRALGWYWLMTGVMLLWILPTVERQTAWFRFIHVGFMAVGVASAMTIAESGTNVHLRYDALVFEFGIPILAMVWQAVVARNAAVETVAG